MARPDVTVVMPFAGVPEDAAEAIDALLSLTTAPGDELMLVDNSGTATHVSRPDRVRVVRAAGERSPAHARNVGAALAQNDWILFLDADCVPSPELIDAYFSVTIDERVGALAGEVVAAPAGPSLVARYAGARNFLGQEVHLTHGYRPRAAAANLLVRREAFERVGGFLEGLRAAEDTDFCWRLQAAGWSLEGRASARVEHRYRTTLRALRSQWRGYAAGRAWLARRYEGFEPQPAAARALDRLVHRVTRRGAVGPSARQVQALDRGAVDRTRFAAIDALLGVEELAGFVLSNRPHPAGVAPRQLEVVLVADRFPARDDPLVDLARALAGARVEAAARPAAPDHDAARELKIDYREDDGSAGRLLALLRLLIRHPTRIFGELFVAHQGPSLLALAPAALRIERDRPARVHPLGTQAVEIAGRLARLAGTQLGAPGS